MTHPLDDVVTRHKAGARNGVVSVCSAHPLVLRAAADQAVADGSLLLVEATSNQVDQTGGYTGMRPADFRDLVHRTAHRQGLPHERVVLGGDHLGPNRWRHLPAEQAMGHADDLVRAYVEAGFTKIHLDCTYPCAGETGPLSDEVVAERAARLLAVAEQADQRSGRLRYVIGSEVPVPGGAHETIDHLTPTSSAGAEATLDAHRSAFTAVGLEATWPQVMALVVQPGVEFDHLRVIDYDPTGTSELQTLLDGQPHMLFEAHSTDYQTTEHLTALVEDHWAVLKVGPGLTFALREALFALSGIEAELLPAARRADLPGVLEQRMLAEPTYWKAYYDGDADTQRVARRYSYSDRLRYYWPDPDVHRAQQQLLSNLGAVPIPQPLLSQFLPTQYEHVRDGLVVNEPYALALDSVRDVLRSYAMACRTSPAPAPTILPRPSRPLNENARSVPCP
jgi:D-tagatose-1,6-bisphosphate aldolase subunit GatZ/KbaZ